MSSSSNSMYAASIGGQQKKKHSRNPFTYFFQKQYKSTPTNTTSAVVLEEKQGIFGIPLCDASKVGSILWGLQVPGPVALCFLEISKRGLKTEGIFRLSGATSEVMSLENKINMYSPDERKEKIHPNEFDIHTLTSLVKKYLRELPEPVIPNAFHEQFQQVDLDDQNEQAIHGLGSIIVKLPFYNRQLLHAILLMASRIQQQVDINMMCPEALATVFAPVCTGFEQSLKDMRISNSSSTASNYTFHNKKQQNGKQTQSNIETTTEMIGKHIKRNKNWTNIWKVMIEQHTSLISILDKQHYQQRASLMDISSPSTKKEEDRSWSKHHHVYQIQQQRSLPSPFSTNGSATPLPNDIIMAQFYPIQQDGTIPVAHPTKFNPRYTPSPPPPLPPQHQYIGTGGPYYEELSNSSGAVSGAQPPPLPPKSSLRGHGSSSTSTGGGTTGAFQRSISKKASFFQKNNTIRKILSASTLR